MAKKNKPNNCKQCKHFKSQYNLCKKTNESVSMFDWCSAGVKRK